MLSTKTITLRFTMRCEGHVDVAKVLIQNGAEVNVVNKDYNKAALHRAARHGCVSVTKVLIQNGADVNAVDIFN